MESTTSVPSLANLQAQMLGADLKTQGSFCLGNQRDSLSSIPAGAVEMSGLLPFTREQGQKVFLPRLFVIADTICSGAP